MVDCDGGVLDDTIQESEGVDAYVLRSELWLGEVLLEYLDCVRYYDGFCCFIDYLESVVVIQSVANG